MSFFVFADVTADPALVATAPRIVGDDVGVSLTQFGPLAGMSSAFDTSPRTARTIVCDVSSRCAGEGFITRPFTAHTWVQAEGAPVGEQAEAAEYVVMQSVPVSA